MTAKDLVRSFLAARTVAERSKAYIPTCTECALMKPPIELKAPLGDSMYDSLDGDKQRRFVLSGHSTCTSSRLHLGGRVLLQLSLPKSLGEVYSAPMT